MLIVGPNAKFLDYISAVLPSFGETDVVFAPPGELYPGVVATAEDTPEAARLKGDLSMVDIMRRAVENRQELPRNPIEIELDDVTLHIDRALAAEARERARATGLPHNPARRHFREHLGGLLVEQGVRKIGQGWLEPHDPPHLREEIAADLREDLRAHPGFHEAVEQLWPALTPQRLLAELLASPERLEAVLDHPGTAAALLREKGDAWTVSDVPLLDELAEFLGEDAVEEERRSAARERAERQYAQEVLHILDAYDDPDGEAVRAGDVVDAAALAERQRGTDHRALAERAKEDRNWVYGHLVVDEAQELSPMAWRVLMRRCPSRSATVVGDLAQRHSSATDADWGAALSPYAGDRWVHRSLLANYRVPAEIMRLAAGVLREIDPGLEAPLSVRRGEKPWTHRVERGELAAAVRAAVAREAAMDRERSIAVVAAPATLATLALPEEVVPLSPVEAKGLEFDVVIVVCPDEILNNGQRGPADLYVALTRPTHRLGIVHTVELPSCLDPDGAQEIPLEEVLVEAGPLGRSS